MYTVRDKTVSPIISLFRDKYTVETVIRMHNVHGRDLAISGDAPLAFRSYERCDRCNYDRHICPGCGDNLHHGLNVCDDCRKL